MGLHDGHRQRLKKRFREEGLANFEPRHVLELLLFYSVPRKDTAPLAQRLLDHFGSVPQVLEASVQELGQVEGITENTSTLIALTTELARYYMVKRVEKTEVLNTLEKCGNYLVPYFFGKSNESVMLLCLDAKCKVLCCKEVGQGSVNSAAISVRSIVQAALSVNATTVVLAHNHPSGLALPSAEDVQTTIRISQALEAVDVILADHIIVADDDYVSLVQSGLFDSSDVQLHR